MPPANPVAQDSFFTLAQMESGHRLLKLLTKISWLQNGRIRIGTRTRSSESHDLPFRVFYHRYLRQCLETHPNIPFHVWLTFPPGSHHQPIYLSPPVTLLLCFCSILIPQTTTVFGGTQIPLKSKLERDNFGGEPVERTIWKLCLPRALGLHRLFWGTTFSGEAPPWTPQSCLLAVALLAGVLGGVTGQEGARELDLRGRKCPSPEPLAGAQSC